MGFFKGLFNTEESNTGARNWRPELNMYFGERKGSDSDYKATQEFESGLGLITDRIGEIGDEFEQRGTFLTEASQLEAEGINREAVRGVSSAQNASGYSGMAVSGGAEQAIGDTQSSFTDKLRGNAMSLMQNRFNLGIQERDTRLGLQTSAIDLYSSYRAGLDKSDKAKEIDIYGQLGV